MRQRIIVNLVEFNEKTQFLLNSKLKRKIVKFVKFVTAFNPGHKVVKEFSMHQLFSSGLFQRSDSVINSVPDAINGGVICVHKDILTKVSPQVT